MRSRDCGTGFVFFFSKRSFVKNVIIFATERPKSGEEICLEPLMITESKKLGENTWRPLWEEAGGKIYILAWKYPGYEVRTYSNWIFRRRNIWSRQLPAIYCDRKHDYDDGGGFLKVVFHEEMGLPPPSSEAASDWLRQVTWSCHDVIWQGFRLAFPFNVNKKWLVRAWYVYGNWLNIDAKPYYYGHRTQALQFLTVYIRSQHH